MQPQNKFAILPDPIKLGDPTTGADTTGVGTPYEPQKIVQDQYDPMKSHLTFSEAMYYSWRYDSMVNAVANRLARPNEFDQSYVASGRKEAMIKEMQAQYGNGFNTSMLETAKEVTSQREEDWFRETVNNKMLSEQAWDDHVFGALAGNILAPENFLIGYAGGAIKAAKVTPKLLTWLDKAIPSNKAQVALYGALGASVGGLQAVPNVAWNYDPEYTIPIAMALGGALSVGLAARVDPNKFIQKIADSPASKESITKPNGVFGVKVSELLSMADELDMVQEGLGGRFFGNAAKGIKQDIDSAASRTASLKAKMSTHLDKLEQGFKTRGLANQGLVENIKQVFGFNSTTKQLEQEYNFSLAQQRAIAFLGNNYNAKASLEARKEAIDGLITEINKHEQLLGVPPTTSGTIDDLVTKVNTLREEVYKKELDEYESAKKDPTKKLILKKPFEPARYTPPMAAIAEIKEETIDSLSDLERAIVEEYYNSGVAEALGKMVNEQGNELRTVMVDKNYFHTRFDLNKIDDMAVRVAERVRTRMLKEADAKQAEIKTLKIYLKDAKRRHKDAEYDHKRLSNKYHSLDPQDPSLDIVQEQLEQAKLSEAKLRADIQAAEQKIGDNKSFIARVRGTYASRSYNSRMKDAYVETFGMMGEQMADAIKRCTGTEVDPRKVGAFLAMKSIPNVGHQAMRDALQSLQLENETKLAELILEVGGDLQINDALAKDLGEEGLGLQRLIQQATELHSVDNLKLVGEASAFRSRFLWDYNKPSKITGYSLYELLSDDFLNTVTRNIEEECSRVGLSHAFMYDGNRQFYLNSGANITRAQNLIKDIAKRELNYGEDAATDLATMTFDALLGRATGEKLGPRWQALTQIAQMIQLKNSGLYNIVDTVNIAHVFGATKVIEHMIPALQMGLGTEKLRKADGKMLRNIVARMYAMEARVRPELAVLNDDMTDISKAPIIRGIMNSAQYMRWFNGQAQVAQWQANMCSSIYEEALEKALRDNDWDLINRAGHTFNAEDIDKMKKLYAQHGLDVESWEDSVLAEKVIRNCFDVTTNTALQVRRGDRPRFLNTTVGKVCFAYQSFVWAANNKLTRRFMHDYGKLGAASFLVKQLPLAALMAISVQALNGKDPFADTGALANSVINAWSGLGLVGWAGSLLTADIGGTAPGLGVLNTARDATSSLVSDGDPTKLIKNIPLLGGFLPYRIAIAALCGTLE